MAQNGISTATSSTAVLTKLYRKELKLAEASLKRQGYTLTSNGNILTTSATLTTTSAASYSSGTTMTTFRVLNRGGNWDEFFANWTNGTWSCLQFPGSVVINMINPGDDSPSITITDGLFVANQFYSFTGNVITTDTANTSSYAYRTLNNITSTHVSYVGTTTSTVIGSASPTIGRPWSTNNH